MPSRTGTPAAGFFFSDQPLVDLFHLEPVDLLAGQQFGVAAIGDLDLLQHLPDDHLDVLVVDRHALQPIDLLDLVHQVGGQLLDALDRKDVVRGRVAVHDEVADLHHVAVLQVDVLALRDQVLDRLGTIVRGQRQATLVLVVAAELDRAGLLRDDGRILRTTRLEQLRHARQTARDVAGLGALGGDTGEHVAGLDLRARIGREDRVDRQQVAGVAATGELGDLAVLALDDHRRTQIRRTGGAAPVDDHALGDAGRLVHRLDHRRAVDQILVADHTVDFGEDRAGVGIPFGDALAALDRVALVDLAGASRIAAR